MNLCERETPGVIDAGGSRRTTIPVLPLTNCLDLVRDPQLFENAATHVVHGRFRDARQGRDLFIGDSPSHEFQQPDLGGRERSSSIPSTARAFSTRLRFGRFDLRARDAVS